MENSPRKVLLIDGEMLIPLAVSQAYRDAGPYFITTSSVTEALQKMKQFTFDLFLLALDPQDQTRLQLLRIIDQRFPQVPVIIMANDMMEYSGLIEQIGRTKQQGSWQLLEKPFNLDVLIILIEKCLAQRKQPRIVEGRDKRRELRNAQTQEIRLTLDGFTTLPESERMVNATLTDISTGGLGLITNYPLKKSQLVSLGKSAVSRPGVVAWTALQDDHRWRAGIRFC